MTHSYTVQRCQVASLLSQAVFADTVKPPWCIAEPMEPLGNTNQNWWDVKLLPMSVLTYPVHCVCLCHLLGTQDHCLCPNGRVNLPSPCPPTPLYTTPVILQEL